MTNQRDEFENKGAMEQDRPRSATNTSLNGQLGHRDQNALIKDSDSDFPEKGNSPEHSGETEDVPDRGMVSDTEPRPSPERDTVDQDPGEAQKRNQDEKDDPLAA